MKKLPLLFLAALPLMGCTSEEPVEPVVVETVSPEQCRAEHIRLLQEQSNSGEILVPDITQRLLDFGCGEDYQKSIAPAEPVAAPGYVDPLAGVDEGSPPANYEKSYSCSSPEEGVKVCEGDVPASVGEFMTPAEYVSSR